MKLEEEMKPLGKICEKLMDAVTHELDRGIENVDTKELSEVIDMIKDVYEAKKELAEACFKKYVLEEMEKESEEGEEETDGERMYYRGQPRSESGRFMSRNDGRRSNRGRGRRNYEPEMMYEDMDIDYMDYGMGGRMYYGGSGSSGGSSQGSQGSSQGGSQGQSGGGMRGYSGGSQGSSQGGQSSGQSSSGGSRYYGGSESSEKSKYDKAKEGYQQAKQSKDGSHMKSLEEYAKEMTEDILDVVKDMDSAEKQLLKSKVQMLASKIV